MFKDKMVMENKDHIHKGTPLFHAILIKTTLMKTMKSVMHKIRCLVRRKKILGKIANTNNNKQAIKNFTKNITQTITHKLVFKT